MRVASGTSILLDITDGSHIEGTLASTRKWLMITSEVQVAEEEKEQLGIDSTGIAR